MIQRLEDLDFADDICMLSHRLQDANNQMERLNTTAQRVGLKIHPGKTKVMRINAIQQGEVRRDQSYIEEVEEFTYLGSVMNKTGGTDEDIAARRKKAQQAFAMLTPVWRSKDLRTATKIRIFNTNVKAVLLYGSETWRVTTASTKQVQTFINKCLRRILRVYWPEVISNKDLWIRTGQEPIVTTIKRRCWKWIGHTLRKGERNSVPCDGLESARNTKMWWAQNYMAQKHTEGPEGDQHDLVRSQKSCSGLTEMESNCGRPMSPMEQRGLDDDDDDGHI